MITKRQPIILVDSSTLIYAAFYTYGTLNYHGQPTGIIYGFLKKVLMLAKKLKSTDFIFCYDAGVSHRHGLSGVYKANREAKRLALTEEEKEQRGEMLDQAIALRRKVLPYLGFKNNHIEPNYEADDLLARWILDYKDSQRKIIMVTTDSDMFQCLNNCSIYNPTTKKLFTRKHFIKKFGIKPDQWALAKAIGGCSGDNVIGVDGVSDPKNATSKALKYIRGELTEGMIYDRIRGSEDQIKLNLKLVSLPFNDKMKRMIIRRSKFSRRRFIKTFDKYHFKSLLEEDKFKEWEGVFKLNG